MGHGDHLKVLKGGAAPAAVGSPEWSQRLRDETKELVDGVESSYMLLAEKLWMIFSTPTGGDPMRGPVCTSWQDKDGNYFRSFDQYVDSELGIHRKKAQRLRVIWHRLKIDLQLDEKMLARVVKLGFSKVRELARDGVLTRGNVEQWVVRAENMTCYKLMTTISDFLRDKQAEMAARQAEEEFEREYNGSPGSKPVRERMAEDPNHEDEDDDEEQPAPAPEQKSKFFCPLFGDQIETVNLAMKRAAELSNSDKLGNNLSLICLDFLATNDFRFANEQQRLRFLAKYEKLTGYKMIIVDPDAGEVVYGIDTLEKLARSQS